VLLFITFKQEAKRAVPDAQPDGKAAYPFIFDYFKLIFPAYIRNKIFEKLS